MGTFVAKWQAEQSKRARRLEAQKAEALEQQKEQLKREYDGYCDALVHDYLQRCASEEIEDIHRLSEEEAKDSQPVFRPTALRLAERRIVRTRCTIPTYDMWIENRK